MVLQACWDFARSLCVGGGHVWHTGCDLRLVCRPWPYLHGTSLCHMHTTGMQYLAADIAAHHAGTLSPSSSTQTFLSMPAPSEWWSLQPSPSTIWMWQTCSLTGPVLVSSSCWWFTTPAEWRAAVSLLPHSYSAMHMLDATTSIICLCRLFMGYPCSCLISNV